VRYLDFADSHDGLQHWLTVVFYYDFALTLPREIEHIWSSKLSLIKVLLVALRYNSVIGYASTIWLEFWSVPKEGLAAFTLCENLVKLPGISGIICQGLTLVFLIIRLFAIYDKRKWILFATIPLGLLNIVSSIIGLAEITSQSDGVQDFGSNAFSTCFAMPSSGESLLFYELGYITYIVFDTLIFFLSVLKMGRMYRAHRLFHSGSSFVNILLRDGNILYAMSTISNVLNFIIFMLATRGVETEIRVGTSNELTPALCAILASRMIFNLREAGTEIFEGTEEWRTRIERATKDMQFRIPTTVQQSTTDILEDLDGCSGAEVGVPTQENASA